MFRVIVNALAILLIWLPVNASQTSIDELERRLVNTTDTARVNMLLDLSVLYLRSDSQKADSIAELAYDEARAIDFIAGTIRAGIYLGNIKSFNGQGAEGERLCKVALFKSDSINDIKLLSESYNLRYLLYYRKGIYDSATLDAQRSLELAEQSNHIDMLARGNQNMGILNSIRGNHAEAIKHFLISEKYYEQLGNEFALALLLGNLGVTFEEAGNYDKALEYMFKQLEIGETLNDDFLRGNVLVNIGAVQSQIGQQDSAFIYYKKSLAIASTANNVDLMIINLDNIGSYYSNKQQFEKATIHLQDAYNMALEKGFEYQNVYVTGHLAQNYLAQQKYDSALIYALEQLNLALEYEFLYDQKLAHENLSKIYAAKNDFQNAYKSQLQYASINDSLFSQEKSSQIEGLREQYESEKKEREIENLTAKNEAANYRNISYAGAAISFFILGGLLYYLQRSRIKRNRLLLAKEKELDKMKSRFFANISHEFRTPLTLILSPIDDMIDRIEQSNIKKQLAVMKRNASRLLDLVNQLLDLSKIESGKLKLQVTCSDIIAATKGVAMSFHSIAEQKNIDLVMDVQPGELPINYDREKWETILTNILSNAFKFTPDNGRILIESKLIKRKEREFLQFTFSDSGVGIPKDEIDQIFNRFFQADSDGPLQQEGSGIGLALTKELVDLHLGSITVESEPEEGTSFKIDLPIDLPNGKPTAERKSTEISPILIANQKDTFEVADQHAQLQDSKPTVLVIEDHEDVRDYIKETLNNTYAVICAMDGEEGIATALDKIPDLIVSDVMMPKKDGYQVCTTLKQDEKTSHIPIILLTAKSDSEDKVAGLMTRADDYVTKPFAPKELLIRIKNLIDSRRQLRERYKKEGIVKPKDIAVNSIDERFLEHLIALVEQHIGNERLSVEMMGDELGMSRSQLHRKMTALLGQSPNQFVRSFRLQRAHDLLKQKAATASEIAYQVGFNTHSYFSKCFHEQFGYSPSEVTV